MITIKEITLEITQYCPHNCEYCSTKATKERKHLMDMDLIIDFIRKENPDIINISGGEPLSHPDFYSILKYCKEKIGEDNVWVYTNAIKNIRFNSDIIEDGITTHANTIIKEGKINIPKADKVHFLELQKHGNAKKNNMKKVDYEFSGDLCENCNHKVLQVNKKTTKPCNKEY